MAGTGRPRLWALPRLLLLMMILGATVVSEARAGFTGDLLVTNQTGGNFMAFDFATGTNQGTFGTGTLTNPQAIAFGPDGNVYVSDIGSQTIQRYSGANGSSLGTFVSAASGGLAYPNQFVFNPAGLLVSSYNSQQVLQYNATNGSPVGVFAAGNGLLGPIGLAIAPNGNLLVISSLTNQILAFNGLTGAYVGVFASGNGLNAPAGATLGPDGNLYVANYGASNVLEFNGTTGAFLGVFATGNGLVGPSSVVFGSDGNFYVANYGVTGNHPNDILKYTSSGSYLGVFASGLTLPIYLASLPVPEPAGLVLMAIGTVGLLGWSSTRRESVVPE
jgi:sugar lactone lactonase YvrE